MAKLFSFFDSNQVSQELKDILFDMSIVSKYSTLENYLSHMKREFSSRDLVKLRKLVEQQVFEQAEYLSFLYYHFCEVTGYWGAPGEQQLKIAFCRHLLEIPNEQSLTHEDAMRFMTLVSERLQELGISSLTKDQTYEEYKHYSFSIFGKQFPVKMGAQITPILKFLGSKRFLHSSPLRGGHKVLYGIGDSKVVVEFDVTLVRKEIVRSPSFVMSNAAFILGQRICLREDAFQAIYFQKWVPVLNQSADVQWKIGEQLDWNLSQGIKEQALALYEVSKPEGLESAKPQFLKDMRETIMFHELGHGVLFDHIFGPELMGLANGPSYYDSDMYAAIKEFLTDFAADVGSYWGPMVNMIKISEKDQIRAERMFWMYFSDVWFYDTEDEHMFKYSHLICTLLVKYVSQDKSIDFKRMAKDMAYDTTGKKPKEKWGLIERIYELFRQDLEGLRQICKEAVFTVGDEEMPFDKLWKYWLDQCLREASNLDIESYSFLAPFWNNIFMFVATISDSKDKLAHYIESADNRYLRRIMIMSAGRKTAEDYNYDYRKYVQDKLLDAGVVGRPEFVHR